MPKSILFCTILFYSIPFNAYSILFSILLVVKTNIWAIFLCPQFQWNSPLTWDHSSDATAPFCVSVIPCGTVQPYFNTLRLRQDGRLFPDDIFKCIFFSENVQILIKISLTFVPKAPINNIPALVQIMAWRRSGNKPLSEPMMVRLLTHICVTQPQLVNT